jgi:hypothetical protein
MALKICMLFSSKSFCGIDLSQNLCPLSICQHPATLTITQTKPAILLFLASGVYTVKEKTAIRVSVVRICLPNQKKDPNLIFA